MFGLGNVQYEHFNATGKRVFKHLKTIGGNPIVQLGLGDDDADIADDFAVWLEQLVAAIESAGLLKASQPENDTAATDAAYEVEYLNCAAEQCADVLQGYVTGSTHAKAPTMLQVKTVRELHGAASDRSCVHVELALGTYVHYSLRCLVPIRTVRAVGTSPCVPCRPRHGILRRRPCRSVWCKPARGCCPRMPHLGH